MGVEALAFATAITSVASGQKQARDTRKQAEHTAKETRKSANVAQNKIDRERKETILRKLRRRDRGGSDTPTRSTILSSGQAPAPAGSKTLLGQ